ncbi:CynX/NimT family MFS transporter [Paenibacillus polymyxa]|uniref:CynX/NimT family MFS transporter n=1 Tax=Paenibacillus polymyxa TaxID=1406 RepID=UPI000F8838B7|nr:MFS transporter [Paenibacillus polymyxa]MDP9677523.1 CP family cyanate transporter-like MFS transporter [Paenibacillus jamilae]MDU8673526.1 MFS transporter [Paenibacillus polymyxa]MDU8698431.1 MFS transporter [Paenibacillus polymyxa]QDA27188.1 MFS transporter [Paenibacillus polymyxa]RTZ35231.1 MFS transporter [Paenibacillus polymyxa]
MSSQQHQRALLYKSLWHAGPWLLAVGIILVGANLRASITSVGPLIGLIKDSLHISNTLSGLLTTLPLLAFALLSPFVAKLSRRFGSSLIIFAALLLLTAGIVVRSTLGVTALFVGTAMLGLAIAVCNVLLPSLIKEEFPRNSGLMTGVYSVSMNVVAATASGLSIPLALNGGMGWRGALGIWAIIGVVGILLWVPQLLKVRRTANQAVVSARTVNVYKSSLAWKVTLFMGLQSALFYVPAAWFPEMMSGQGMDSETAGWMLSVMQFSQMPFTFIVPIWAARVKDQRLLVLIMAVLYFIGLGGFLLGATQWSVVWVICIGIAGGFAFPLVMMFFNLRTRTPQQAAELSGMAQSFGYLLAATGPTLFGYLHDATQGWTIPLLLLLCLSVLLMFTGLGAAKKRYVGGEVDDQAAI